MNSGPGANNGSSVPKIMVFRPTLQEMRNFSKYIEYMESLGAHHAGLAKIIPPDEWKPRKSGYQNLDLIIKSPIEQVVHGSKGVYQQFNIQKRNIHFRDFKKMCERSQYKTPEHFDYRELERKFWKNVTYNSAIYGADVPGSLTDPECKEFNINNLDTILDLISDVKIAGVNTAYLYFGMWKSSFAWHTEDMDLYSINYLHYGQPKSWYCIPPDHGVRFEKMVIDMFPSLYQKCPAFLRHKMTMISPKILTEKNIPYNQITQEEREFMITFPFAYHAGYNHGFNIAESTNFALERWIDFGKQAIKCHCEKDAVHINMDVFVKRFQPERYEDWLNGGDYGPDPKRPGMFCFSNSPYQFDLFVPEELPNNSKQLHPPPSHNGDERKSKKKLKKAHSASAKSELITSNSTSDPTATISTSTCNGQRDSTDPIKESNDVDNEIQMMVTYNHNDPSCHSGNLTRDGNMLVLDSSITYGTTCTSMIVSSEKDSETNTQPETLEELSKRTFQFVSNPVMLRDEMFFNYYTSMREPHCAVCNILRPFEAQRDIINSPSDWTPPQFSPVLVPLACFAAKIINVNMPKRFTPCSPLLVCSDCKICVHSVCYGVTELPTTTTNWKCNRCVEPSEEPAACCLCPIRGGALKRTNDPEQQRWAHIACALLLPHTKIVSDIDMGPIAVTKLGKNSMTCVYCAMMANFGHIYVYFNGYCVQCHSCENSFHITCGHREGVSFEAVGQSSSIRITCKRCKLAKAAKKEYNNELNSHIYNQNYNGESHSFSHLSLVCTTPTTTTATQNCSP